jgi:HSP20 family protein
MLPIRWEPFRSLSRELNTLHREMDEMFRRTFGVTTEPGLERGAFITPVVNTYTKGDTYFVEAELPGVSKSDLDVSVEGNTLTLRGERKQSRETREEDYFIRESQYGSFIRRLTLPEGVNTEKIHASYEDGVLRISMPVEKKLAAGRKVLIEGAEEGKKKREVH